MKELPEHDDKLEALFVTLAINRILEAEAKKRRISCEERIAALIEGPESGSKTVTLGSGKKITVKRGVNYSADIDRINELEIDDYFPPLQSKTTIVLNIEGYEWYRRNRPSIFALVSQFVETKPKKVAVTIKEKKE